MAQIFETLPVQLRRRLVNELYFSHLQCFPLIRAMEGRYPGFASLVLPRLRPALYKAGEVMVSSSMCLREVTFVIVGACECIPKSSTGIDRLCKPAHPVSIGPGSYFGQVGESRCRHLRGKFEIGCYFLVLFVSRGI
jgi:hypothetical protein